MTTRLDGVFVSDDATCRAARSVRHTLNAPRPFSDWRGSIGLTQDIRYGPQLEADAGLDPRRWFIVAINAELSCSDNATDRISIDAVDLSAFAIDSRSRGYRDLVALVDAYGSLPVTRIDLSGATARDVLRHMTSAHIQVQMVGLQAELNVVAHRRLDANNRGAGDESP